MTLDEETVAEVGTEGGQESVPLRARRRWPRWLGGIFVLLLVAAGYAWFTREDIARNVITGELEKLDLPAQYEVGAIGPRKQVLLNIVIGDPARPDLTIERVEMLLEPRFGVPAVGRITLVKPRLYGSYKDGKLSFGKLDPLLFAEKKEPFRLPDLDIAVIDGRGLLESDFGPVGFKAEGQGPLRDGFKGMLAAVAPDARIAGCTGERISLYAKVSIAAEKPQVSGPLRLGSLSCPAQQLRLAGAAVQLDGTIDKSFDGGEGKLGLTGGALALGGNRMASTSGSASFTYRKQALTARYALAGKGIATPQAGMARLALDGTLRAQDNFTRIEIEGDASGSGVQIGKDLDATLASAQRSAEGSLAAPLLGQIRSALQREGRGSRLSASFIHRQTGDIGNTVVPQATLTGGSGQALLAISRFQMTAGGKTAPRLSGNFSTGGAGLPRIAGRLERGTGGGMTARIVMAEYAAGESRLALPELRLAQNSNGALGFAGSARLSGGLPGGQARNLDLPLDGNWSSAGGLSVWRKCTPVRFDSLSFANLVLDRREVMLCPPTGGGAILRSDARGTRIAAGVPRLDVVGKLGASPIRIASGPLGFAVPGSLTARSLDIALGPRDTASRFRIANLNARIGTDVAGTFAGSEIMLAAVPLDMFEAGGDWRYAKGRLTVTNGAFQLKDRQTDVRFNTLVARDATLTLADNRITADAVMREPLSDREVLTTAIRHDLASAIGSADLVVDKLDFDQGLQPDTLSHLALGVIANAKGSVRGTGRVDWNARDVTSTGRFTTEGLDFAAAFGPVKGLSGTVDFTDLIGLVTAPDQRLRIASINPGIEANDGELSFALQPEGVLMVNGASWPFLDGKLTLEPTRMVLGASEVRRYTLNIEALDAAKFVQRLEMANIAATGTFDGTLPIVFDENGGRIEGGRLVSRPPGGNVSYIGQLSYKDLSPMANFAFDALKSIDYKRMQIDMGGALEGEIVTRVSFDGVSQGAAAKRNFITKRLAGLPIRFNLNMRAPFFKLAGSLRSLYDPTYVRDPREIGILGADGKPLNPNGTKPVIQSPESKDLP